MSNFSSFLRSDKSKQSEQYNELVSFIETYMTTILNGIEIYSNHINAKIEDFYSSLEKIYQGISVLETGFQDLAKRIQLIEQGVQHPLSPAQPALTPPVAPALPHSQPSAPTPPPASNPTDLRRSIMDELKTVFSKRKQQSED